jgi:hypothetical protein
MPLSVSFFPVGAGRRLPRSGLHIQVYVPRLGFDHGRIFPDRAQLLDAVVRPESGIDGGGGAIVGRAGGCSRIRPI